MHCEVIVGNSSAGIREAPVYGIPAINIGNRQIGRVVSTVVRNVGHDVDEIRDAICNAKRFDNEKDALASSFGRGDSVAGFLRAISDPAFWKVNIQKAFVDK